MDLSLTKQKSCLNLLEYYIEIEGEELASAISPKIDNKTNLIYQR